MSGLLSSRLADTQASSLSQVHPQGFFPIEKTRIIWAKLPPPPKTSKVTTDTQNQTTNRLRFDLLTCQEEQLDAILSTAVETSSLGLITGCIKQWTAEGERT